MQVSAPLYTGICSATIDRHRPTCPGGEWRWFALFQSCATHCHHHGLSLIISKLLSATSFQVCVPRVAFDIFYTLLKGGKYPGGTYLAFPAGTRFAGVPVRSYTHAHKQSNNSQSVLYTSISELIYLSITHAQ